MVAFTCSVLLLRCPPLVSCPAQPVSCSFPVCGPRMQDLNCTTPRIHHRHPETETIVPLLSWVDKSPSFVSSTHYIQDNLKSINNNKTYKV
ncbi:hypothetical protein GGR55DRAFT_623755 [Xylaria sp. FL0064]|nr:hypothetical protein GGR55DRAFT_623755 [Xylaria sp. FL0064]